MKQRRSFGIALVVASLVCAAFGTVPALAATASTGSSSATDDDQLLRSQLSGATRRGVPAPTTSRPMAASGLTQCNSSWSPVASSTGGNSTFLLATSALTARDQWAVGGAYPTATSTVEQTYAQHWDGNSWLVTPSPNSGLSNNEFESVAAYAAGEVSAVGIWQAGTDSALNPIWQTLAGQWNGSSWMIVPSANVNGLGAFSNVLNGVVRTSATDGWAVGWYKSPTTGVLQTLVQRWNGSAWTVVSSPNVGTGNNELLSVKARAANDVWAVGFYRPFVGAVRSTLIEHWDGVSWSVIASPNAGTYGNTLDDVSASPAGDLWAGGYWTDPTTGVARSLTERYVAGAWAVVPSNNIGLGNNFLLGMATISATDVWAVGIYTNTVPATSTSIYQGITEHWDGTSWTIGYGLSYNQSRLNSVVALSHSDVWAVGEVQPAPATAYQAFTMNNCTPPAVTGVSPTGGSTAGGSTVTITGTGLVWTTGVNFGATPATSVNIISDTQVTAVSPPGAAGVTDVRIVYFGGLSAITPADQFTYSLPVPGAPTGVSAIAGNASATVSWSAPASSGGSAITAYVITPWVGITALTPTTVTGSPPATTTVITGLTNGTTYTFTVAAQNSYGVGPASMPSNQVTPLTVAGAPTQVNALAGDTEATIKWTSPASNGGSPITSYVVTASPGGASTTVSTIAPAATLTGLTNGTAYTFTVAARNGAGTGPASAASSAATPVAVVRGSAVAVLPVMANGAYGGYLTVAYLENFNVAPAHIRVQYFDLNGTPVGAGNSAAGVPFWGTWTLRQDNANGLAAGQAGSAVIYSDQPLAIFVNEFAPNNAGDATSYTSIKLSAGAGTTVFAPTIANNAYGGYTTGIGLINAGSAATDVRITYRDAGGTVVKIWNLSGVAANAYQGLYSGDSVLGLPSGFAGTATIESTSVPAQPLAAVINEVGPGGQFSSYAAVPTGGTTLYAPVALNNAYGGYYTGMGIQNTTGTAGTVTIKYYDSAGTATTKTFSIAANGYIGVYQGSATDGPAPGAYTATLTSTVAIAAIVNEVAPSATSAKQSTAYNTFAAGSSSLNLPLVESAGADGWSTGEGIMNTGSTATTVTVTYFDTVTGLQIGTVQTATLQPNAYWGLYQPLGGLPNGTRASAWITTSAGGQVAVICNESNATSFMSYSAQ